MNELTCCFTGHRKIPEIEKSVINTRLNKAITELIDNGVVNYLAGGALGFDTLAAQQILELKKKHHHIKLILVLPCINQTRGWPLKDIEEFEAIKSQADHIVYTSKEYYNGCMQCRNRYMVDHSDYCICYLQHNSGGTAYTVNYAQFNNKCVINIAR